jgi:hypothetical protein
MLKSNNFVLQDITLKLDEFEWKLYSHIWKEYFYVWELLHWNLSHYLTVWHL